MNDSYVARVQKVRLIICNKALQHCIPCNAGWGGHSRLKGEHVPLVPPASAAYMYFPAKQKKTVVTNFNSLSTFKDCPRCEHARRTADGDNNRELILRWLRTYR